MGSWRNYQTPLLPPILQAALENFVHGGCHGTSIRQLAHAACLSVPGLYYHYESKQALLAEIDRLAMMDLWSRNVEALSDGPQEPLARFERLVECLLLFHAQQSDIAFIAFSDIRGLQGESREAHIAARDRQQQLLDDVVAECVYDGSFATEFPPRCFPRHHHDLHWRVAVVPSWGRARSRRSSRSIWQNLPPRGRVVRRGSAALNTFLPRSNGH